MTTPSGTPALHAAAAASAEPWHRELAAAIRDPAELCRMLGLDPTLAAKSSASTAGFPFLVPRPFVARMRCGDPHDPLLLQVLPQAAETADVPGYSADPLAERDALAAPGMIRKYAGRALLLVSGGCAVNCRYCFRREFPYAETGAHRRGVDEGIAALAADTSITEAILSGGDPLVVDDARLEDIVARLDAVPHLRRLRLHTRLPVVLPGRVTDRLLAVLAGSRLARVVVVHVNHAAEIDAAVAAAFERLAALPAVLLNQSVLLAGINDSVAALATLSERLVEVGVVPYYLHLLDRVRGAGHFEVEESRATALQRSLQDSLPGYAVPRLVREVPGQPAKVWL